MTYILFVHSICGKQVRIMKGKDSSENKGYAFVTFRSKDLATKAIKDLNNTEFKVFYYCLYQVFCCCICTWILLILSFILPQGRKVKCSTSQAKHKLFVGNIPKSWGEEDIKKVVTKVGPGVNGVELLKVCDYFSWPYLYCGLFSESSCLNIVYVFLNFRTPRIPAEIVVLYSLSTIIMPAQSIPGKRCQPQNLSLMTMLQL